MKEDVPSQRSHPFLLLTPDDVERARLGVGANPAFADWARQLLERANRGGVAELPSLERAWWQEAKAKPWQDTYPDIFHHTYTVPGLWADLARDCAQAACLEPSEATLAKAKEARPRQIAVSGD